LKTLRFRGFYLLERYRHFGGVTARFSLFFANNQFINNNFDKMIFVSV